MSVILEENQKKTRSNERFCSFRCSRRLWRSVVVVTLTAKVNRHVSKFFSRNKEPMKWQKFLHGGRTKCPRQEIGKIDDLVWTTFVMRLCLKKKKPRSCAQRRSVIYLQLRATAWKKCRHFWNIIALINLVAKFRESNCEEITPTIANDSTVSLWRNNII